MSNRFHDKLTELLKSDSRFVDDEGELVPRAVESRAWQIDHDLVRLLLMDTSIIRSKVLPSRGL